MSNEIAINIVSKTSGSGFKDAETELNNVAKAGEKAGASLAGVGKSMQSVGKGLTAAVTLPLLGIGAAAIQASSELNKGMANVASLGVATARVNELKSAVQDLAINTGKSTTDLANGLYQVVSAFGDTADTSKILEIAAKSATAGVADTTDAINLLSAVTKGYGDTSADAVQKTSDLALKTVELGQTTFPELASSIGKVTVMSSSLGIKQQEMFAVFSSLTGVVGGAAEVSTGYRAILQSLQSPTDTMTKLLGSMGFASGAAMIKQYGLEKSIQVISAAAKGTGLPLQNFISQVEGQNAAMALAGAQSGKYASDLAAMGASAGKTDAAFKAQTEGVNAAGFAIQQLKTMGQVFLQDVGDAMGPTLLRVADALQPFIDNMLTLSLQFKNMSPDTQAWIIGLAGAAIAIGPLLFGVGKFVTLLSTALPVMTSFIGIAGALVLPLGLLAGAYALNIGGLKTFVDNGLKRVQAAAPLAGDALHELVAQLTGVGINTYDTTEGIQKFVTTLTGSQRAGIDAGNAVSALGDKIFAAQKIFAEAGGGINGFVAGLGKLTNADVTVNVKSQVTSVDWVGKLGTASYTYNAKSQITDLDWHGDTLGNGAFTYNAKAGIASIDWKSLLGTGTDASFVYDATAGIKEVHWHEELFKYDYSATAGITSVEFFKGLFVGNYTATAGVTSVAWGVYTHTYDTKAQVDSSSVLWGYATHTYDAKTQITTESIDWGAWTHTYNAGADIDSTKVLWGVYTHTYDGVANISNVLWGVYSHSYSAEAGVSETSVLWGAWTHSYEGTAGITGVLWGVFSHSYTSTSSVSSVLWGLWTHSYSSTSSVTSVLWGLFTVKYNATSGITSVEWGLFTKVYDVTAKVSDVLWGVWTKTYDVTANVSSWIASNIPDWMKNIIPKASGDSNFAGGVALVGEAGSEAIQKPNGQWLMANGPQLMDLPKGTKIYKHSDTAAMLAGGIPHFAEGTTTTGVTTPTTTASLGLGGAQAAGFNNFVNSMNKTFDTGSKKLQAAIEKGSQALEGALGKVPGLFGTSEVTQKQMDMAKLGIPQNFADDYIRHLTDSVLNGKKWDGVDIKDAAKRAGIDPTLPAKVILDMVKEQWNTQEFFAGGKNTELINMEAVKKSIAQQQAQASGHASLLALFGIKSEDVTTQGGQIVDLLNQGISQGLTGKGKDGKGKAGASTGIGTAILTGAVNDIKDSKLDAGGQLATALNTQMATSTAFGTTGAAILQKIVDSWGDATKSVDMLKGISDALKIQVDSKDSVEALKNVGGKIAQLLKKGIDDYFASASVADAVAKGVKSNQPASSSSSTPAQNAIGTSWFSGGSTWIGETQPELVTLPRGSSITPRSQVQQAPTVVNNYWSVTVTQDVDINSLAYRVSQVQQRKRS